MQRHFPSKFPGLLYIIHGIKNKCFHGYECFLYLPMCKYLFHLHFQDLWGDCLSVNSLYPVFNLSSHFKTWGFGSLDFLVPLLILSTRNQFPFTAFTFSFFLLFDSLRKRAQTWLGAEITILKSITLFLMVYKYTLSQ